MLLLMTIGIVSSRMFHFASVYAALGVDIVIFCILSITLAVIIVGPGNLKKELNRLKNSGSRMFKTV
jgi:hypothetical protein